MQARCTLRHARTRTHESRRFQPSLVAAGKLHGAVGSDGGWSVALVVAHTDAVQGEVINDRRGDPAPTVAHVAVTWSTCAPDNDH